MTILLMLLSTAFASDLGGYDCASLTGSNTYARPIQTIDREKGASWRVLCSDGAAWTFFTPATSKLDKDSAGLAVCKNSGDGFYFIEQADDESTQIRGFCKYFVINR